MTKDIQPILDGWDFEPGTVSVRIVRGLDGREKVQMRLDMGVLQMEMDGRPDGTRPHGSESLFDHLAESAREYESTDRSEPFRLDDAQCEELLREHVQYYYRYLSFFHLGRYDLAERDTRRNLRLLAFVRRYASSEQLKWRFDQHRPYVILMNTRARAIPLHESKQFRDALAVIDDGIGAIKEFLVEHALDGEQHECAELEFLVRWREEIDRTRPLEAAERLQRQLDQAILSENYERAAKLRDELRKLATRPSAGS